MQTCNSSCQWGGCICFVAGTPVRMADGSERPIEKVRVGDKVLSYDLTTHKVVAAEVTHTFVHAPALAHRTVIVNGTLVATPNHPFYANGGWRPAGKLHPGDTLLRLGPESQVSPTQVRTLRFGPGGMRTFNIEVAGTHDYFARDVLVHNKPICPY